MGATGLGWGTALTHHVSPSHGQCSWQVNSSGTQLKRTPPSPTPPEPLQALYHQPHLLLGGGKFPEQLSPELSQGSPLTSLPPCPRKEVAGSPHCLRGCPATSRGTRFHLAGLWCQNSAFPAPCHGEAALVRGCQSEGCSGPAPSDRGIKGKPTC